MRVRVRARVSARMRVAARARVRVWVGVGEDEGKGRARVRASFRAGETRAFACERVGPCCACCLSRLSSRRALTRSAREGPGPG